MEYKKSLQKEISNTVRLFFEGKHAAKYILLSIVAMTEHGFGYWAKQVKGHVIPSLEAYTLRCRFRCIWWSEVQHTRSFRDINKILLVLCTLRSTCAYMYATAYRDAADAIVASLAGRRTIYNL